jgi:hypothetical protein
MILKVVIYVLKGMGVMLCLVVHGAIILLLLHRFWYGDTVETVDCGDTAAQWLSKYMLNQDCGMRLGYYLVDTMPRRVPFKEYMQCYKTLRSSDMVNFGQFIYYCTSHFMLKRNHT